MSKATKITYTKQPDGSFLIELLFEQESVFFRYDDKNNSEEAVAALSQFKGTITQIGNELTINM